MASYENIDSKPTLDLQNPLLSSSHSDVFFQSHLVVFLLIIFVILGELKAKFFRVPNETLIGPTVKINEEEYIQGSKIVVFTSSQAPKHCSNFYQRTEFGFNYDIIRLI